MNPIEHYATAEPGDRTDAYYATIAFSGPSLRQKDEAGFLRALDFELGAVREIFINRRNELRRGGQ